MSIQKLCVGMIAAAILFKIIFYVYLVFHASQTILSVDSYGYLQDADRWVEFFHRPSAGLNHSFYRTPGYTLFLAILNHGCKIPLLGIVFIQLMLNGVTAVIVYKTFLGRGQGVGLLAAAIVMLDLPTTIYSAKILTESLHLLVIALFLFNFIKYLDSRKVKWLIGAGLCLTLSVYIRPVGFYLGYMVAAFIVFVWGGKNVRTGISHALLLLCLVYGLLGIWEYYNMTRPPYGLFIMSSINQATVDSHGLMGAYTQEKNPDLKKLPPAIYYLDEALRSFLNLMTTPGNTRYLGTQAWKIFGVVFGYSLLIFWWIGLIAGIFKDKKDLVYVFLALVILYFISVTMVSVGWTSIVRFRVPMVPALALLAARGWCCFKK